MAKNKRVKTANQSLFSEVPTTHKPRSIFRIPFSHKTTFNAGKLVPLYVNEVIPGDTFNMSQSFISRLSTPIFPTMDDLNIELKAFFVPWRLVWDGWEDLITGHDGDDTWDETNPPALVPVYEEASSGVSTTYSKCLGDYMGIPVGMDLSSYPVSALYFRAYALIWNEWFRDQNLQAPIPINKGNTITSADYAYGPNSDLLSVNKYHDYFTSALPGPQKGDSPLIPVEFNELIPVITGVRHPGIQSGDSASPLLLAPSDNLNSSYIDHQNLFAFNDSGLFPNALGGVNVDEPSGTHHYLTPVNLYADARGQRINSSTINDFILAYQVQRMLTLDGLAGSRYIEQLRAHFGVEPGDYRLQRPEFLGQYKTLVGMQSVPQTSSTDSVSPQGNVAAYSLTAGNSSLFNKSFVEHGAVFVFAIVRQVKTYQQGLEQMFSRRERLDFYFPGLANIPEQPILNKEIYAFGSSGNEIFGYQAAWASYLYKPNRVSGQMRSVANNSLDIWHYADYYEEAPSLSSEWITDNSAVNLDRTLAISMQDDDQIRLDINFLNIATRPMPVYAIPGLVDHF